MKDVENLSDAQMSIFIKLKLAYIEMMLKGNTKTDPQDTQVSEYLCRDSQESMKNIFSLYEKISIAYKKSKSTLEIT